MSNYSKKQLKIVFDKEINLIKKNLSTVHHNSSKIANVNRLLSEFDEALNK